MSILLDVRGVCSRRRGMSRRVAWAAVVFVGVVAAASEVSVSRGGIARQPGLQTLGAGLAGWEFVTSFCSGRARK